MAEGKPGAGPRREYEINSRRSELAAYVLLAGLAIELLFAFLLEKPWLEQLSTIAGDTLIVGGVWGEIHFGRKAREAGDDLLAESEVRVSEAQRETERLRAQFGWRSLSDEEVAKLISELAKSPGGRVQISYASGDVESCTYAMQFARAFMSAGWKAGLHSGVVQMVVFGIRIPITYGSITWSSEALRRAFAAAGIVFESAPAPPFGMTMGSTVADAGLLYIGPKVMPWAVAGQEFIRMQTSAAPREPNI